MKRYLPIALAFLLGIGVGYLLVRGRKDAPREAPAGGTSERPGTGERSGSGSGSVGSGKPEERISGTPGGRSSALLRLVRERNVRLVEENKRLQSGLSALKQDLLFARGKPAGWPAKVPPRHTRESVVRAVNKALKEAGINGEITDKDCNEYPCVLSGSAQGQVSKERFKRILSTKALQAYRGDHAQTSTTTRTGHDSLGRRWVRSHFAIALMKGGPAGTEPDVKRTVYRLRQLMDATTGQ